MTELTMNVQLSSLALKLRAFRIQSGKSISDIAKAVKIAESDLVGFETDKIKPTRRQLRKLENFYLNN